MTHCKPRRPKGRRGRMSGGLILGSATATAAAMLLGSGAVRAGVSMVDGVPQPESTAPPAQVTPRDAAPLATFDATAPRRPGSAVVPPAAPEGSATTMTLTGDNAAPPRAAGPDALVGQLNGHPAAHALMDRSFRVPHNPEPGDELLDAVPSARSVMPPPSRRLATAVPAAPAPAPVVGDLRWLASFAIPGATTPAADDSDSETSDDQDGSNHPSVSASGDDFSNAAARWVAFDEFAGSAGLGGGSIGTETRVPLPEPFVRGAAPLAALTFGLQVRRRFAAANGASAVQASSGGGGGGKRAHLWATKASASTTSQLAADPAPAASFTSAANAAPALPAGIGGFKLVDLNPTGGTWVTSRSVRSAGGKSGGYVSNSASSVVHAAMWTTTASSSIIDLQPGGTTYTTSQLLDVSGTQQVGFATTNGGGNKDHAMVWAGNSASAVDLNPTGYSSSYAQATTGTQQVGYAYSGSTPHAMLWNSSAASYVDLNPTGYYYSYALAATTGTQAGYAATSAGGLHALVWHGSATATDIHPGAAFNDSRATAVFGSQAGGYGASAVTGYNHAIYWSSLNGASAVDLNPAGFKDSQVTGVNGAAQVGFGRLATDTAGLTHALMWLGSAATVTDLNQYLPSNYDSAEADGVDANGNVVGVAHDTVSGYYHAVVWVAQAATPEPGPLVVMIMGLPTIFSRNVLRRKAT